MVRLGRGATRLFWRCRSSRIATPERRNARKRFMKSLGFSQYNGGNREPLFVPGGSVMYILVPWKPVVLVWGLLSAMIFFGFVASSVLEGNCSGQGLHATNPQAGPKMSIVLSMAIGPTPVPRNLGLISMQSMINRSHPEAS